MGKFLEIVNTALNTITDDDISRQAGELEPTPVNKNTEEVGMLSNPLIRMLALHSRWSLDLQTLKKKRSTPSQGSAEELELFIESQRIDGRLEALEVLISAEIQEEFDLWDADSFDDIDVCEGWKVIKVIDKRQPQDEKEVELLDPSDMVVDP